MSLNQFVARPKRSIPKILGSATAVALAAALQLVAAPGARALDIGPKSIPLTIAGVPVEIPLSGTFDAKTDSTALELKGSATGDLQAIQDNALAIAKAINLPHDNCARNGLNIVVKSIDGATIAPLHDGVAVEISGRAAVWACAKMLGEPLRSMIVEDSFVVIAPLELYLPNPQTVALRLTGPAKLKTGSSLTKEAAKLFVHDVNAALSAQIDKLLDMARARAAAPTLPGLDVHIASAAFGHKGSKLTVRASGKATMSSEAFTSLLGYLQVSTTAAVP